MIEMIPIAIGFTFVTLLVLGALWVGACVYDWLIDFFDPDWLIGHVIYGILAIGTSIGLGLMTIPYVVPLTDLIVGWIYKMLGV